MNPISASQIKRLRSLHRKKGRHLHNQFIIEGFRLVEEALKSDTNIVEFYVVESTLESREYNATVHALETRSIPTFSVSEKELRIISDTDTPQGILATCSIPGSDLSAQGNWVFLDQLQDPGNAGTLLRSAAWLGVKNVCFSKGCVDPFSPKTVRSGMGAQFYMNIVRDSGITEISNGRTVLGADMSGVSALDLQIPSDWVLVIGSEAHGISQLTRKHILHQVAIPKFGRGESLNAAVAGSILLSELTRR